MRTYSKPPGSGLLLISQLQGGRECKNSNCGTLTSSWVQRRQDLTPVLLILTRAEKAHGLRFQSACPAIEAVDEKSTLRGEVMFEVDAEWTTAHAVLVHRH